MRGTDINRNTWEKSMTVFSKLGSGLFAVLIGSLLGSAIVPLSGTAGESTIFTDAFEVIAPEDIDESVFTLVGNDWSVITAGRTPNSMVASFGGYGILFGKPATWCFLRANRFTLEKMREEGTYTMSYFPEQYRNDILQFGQKSGRDSTKMEETKLTPASTPDGFPTYMEAKLVLELKLVEVTTVAPDDFLTQEGKDFVEGAYKELGEYHKIVFGEIVKVWRKR